jgi:hypothetical protein
MLSLGWSLSTWPNDNINCDMLTVSGCAISVKRGTHNDVLYTMNFDD